MDEVHRKAMRGLGLLMEIGASQDEPRIRSLYMRALTIASNRAMEMEIEAGKSLGSGTKKEILLREISDHGLVDEVHAIASSFPVSKERSELLEILDELALSEAGPDAPQHCPECSYRLDVSYDSLLLVCHFCGEVLEVNDMNICPLERLPKTKVGIFKPNRHFKQWMDRIFARNPPESLSEEIIDRIRRGCIAKRLTMEMGVEDLRSVLRELKLTAYNGDVPYILMKITRRGPPAVSPEVTAKVTSLFLEIMEVRGDVKKDGRTNRIYYPYYIYKLYDIFLTDEEERKILEFIHLHAAGTLSSNDEEWRSICETVPSLRGKYRPTVLKVPSASGRL